LHLVKKVTKGCNWLVV